MEVKRENRVVDGLLGWTEKERNLKEIFGSDVSKGRDFLQTKRDFFSELYQNSRQNPNPDEKVMLAIVQGEIRKMDKQLHPNAIARVIAKAAKAVKDWIRVDIRSQEPGKERSALTVKQLTRPYRKEGQKVNGSRQELHEANSKAMNDYLKKRTGTKQRKTPDTPAAGSKNTLMQRRVRNPHNSHGIH